MDYIRLTSENLDSEHICCAISSNKDPQVLSKKQWLRDRLEEGLVFLKADVRGKCFIEYIPAEYAWVPIEAAGYMHINCFWVSGSCKGQGYSNALLAACIAGAKARGMQGLTVISSHKNSPSCQTPATWPIKAFAWRIRRNPFSPCCTCPLMTAGKSPASKRR